MTRDHLLISQLEKSPEYIQAKKAFLDAVQAKTKTLNSVRGASSPEIREQYLAMLKDYGKSKGRDQYYNYLASGIGNGPFVELLDGSVKMDLITGIGINFFGHTHPELVSELLTASLSDTMQGNLQPGVEAKELIETILKHVGPKSRLKMAWPFCSGTMSNENALKIIRQKKFPASSIFAFTDCFAGRSTTMAEITDSPGYRQGQPIYGEVTYLPFYDPMAGLEASIDATVSQMKAEVARHPAKYAGLMIELVQGEGGIRSAPREWYVKVFEAAKAAGLLIWADEVQTFGRTPQLFAYQTFDLAEYIDVVTVGKLLHACMTLWTEELNPKPGLVAGTFTGSAAALRTGTKILNLLTGEGYYGPEGKIAKLSKYFTDALGKLKAGSCEGLIGDIRAVGGLIGFGVLSGSMDDTKKVLMKLFDEGIVAFYAGHDPYLIRVLPPFGTMTEAHIDQAMAILEKTLILCAAPSAGASTKAAIKA